MKMTLQGIMMIMIVSDLLMRGCRDIFKSIISINLWVYLGFMDIRFRYRRTFLGPWWNVLNNIIMILILSLIWSRVLNYDLNEYLLYFSLGYIFWSYIAGQITESASGFQIFKSIVQNINLPSFSYALRISMRHIIVMLHNLPLIFGVIFIADAYSRCNIFLFFISFIIVQANISLIVNLTLFLSSRFRDFTQIINTIVQVLFFCTPVLWKIDSLKGDLFIITFNPMYHWIEILRQPLMSGDLNYFSFVFSVLSLFILFLLNSFIIGCYSKKIPFWV